MNDLLNQLADHSETMTRFGAAVIVSFIIGLERQARDKPAGLRTVMLICIGACGFAIVSDRMAGPFIDRTRIAAQIITGVGFLGAGAILRDARTVYGLTTAATIWMIAALGMACGFGLYAIALAGTLVTLIVLVVMQRLAGIINRNRKIDRYRLATANKKADYELAEKVFTEAGLKVMNRACYREGDKFIFRFRVVGHEDEHDRLRQKLLHAEDFLLMK